MTDLISVVVPVYNVKVYLDTCINSILNQTYKNLEIIIVDDGSTDGSSEICNKFLEVDNRIKVIHQENKGLSYARNVGIEISKGEFLTFVDSDDYIHKEMIEILYKNIKKYDADISFCDYSFIEEELEKNTKDISILLNSKEMFMGLYNENHIRTIVAWSKLYKKEVFSNIRYPIGKRYEDGFVIHKILDKFNKLVYSDNKLYYYRQREDSIMKEKYSLKNLDMLESILDRMNYMKSKGYDYFYSREFFRYANGLKENYEKIRKYLPNEKEKQKELLVEFCRTYNKTTRKLIVKNKLRWKLDLFYIKCLFNIKL